MLVGGIGGRGGIKMASAKANEPAKDPISGFCRAAEMDFQHLTGTRNVS